MICQATSCTCVRMKSRRNILSCGIWSPQKHTSILLFVGWGGTHSSNAFSRESSWLKGIFRPSSLQWYTCTVYPVEHDCSHPTNARDLVGKYCKKPKMTKCSSLRYASNWLSEQPPENCRCLERGCSEANEERRWCHEHGELEMKAQLNDSAKRRSSARYKIKTVCDHP